MGWNDDWSWTAGYSPEDVTRCRSNVYRNVSAVDFSALIFGDGIGDFSGEWSDTNRLLEDGPTQAKVDGIPAQSWSGYCEITFSSPISPCGFLVLFDTDSRYTCMEMDAYIGGEWVSMGIAHEGLLIGPLLVTSDFAEAGIDVVDALIGAMCSKVRIRLYNHEDSSVMKKIDYVKIALQNDAPFSDPTHWQKLTGCAFAGNF